MGFYYSVLQLSEPVWSFLWITFLLIMRYSMCYDVTGITFRTNGVEIKSKSKWEWELLGGSG